jgi:phosphohistidine swiveling domain-containing protein
MYWLIEDCKRYGTLPFAGLARAGFIAVQLLRSLVTTGILDAVEYQSFMSSLDTVSSGMTADFATLGRDAFLEKYGHLRPGTYDILSPRYDEAPDRYFDWSAQATAHPPRGAPFSLSLEQMRRTKKLLDEHGLEHDVLGLFEFIKAAIEGREYAKFIFTKSLSDVLTLFGRLGAEHGFSSEDCAYAHVECIRTLYSSSSDPRQVLAASISEGRTAHAMTRQINLPPLITDASDVFGFRVPGSDPNFITMGQATGRVAFPDHDRQALRGTILLIPSADPGFDWIFATGIAGFITMFGGSNSHMAIRAAELGVPAVIGAGETLFNTWSKAGSLEIDCANRQVKVLR